MRTLILFGTVAIALAPHAAHAESYRCSGDAAYRRALEVRSLVRDFHDVDALWRDDVDHSMALAHGSPWRVGAEAYGAFQSIPALPCESDASPVKQTLSSVVDTYQVAFFDTVRQVEIRAFRLESIDMLATGIPTRAGSDFTVGYSSRARALTGGSVRFPWAEATYGYEDGHGNYLRLGVPRLGGLAWDVLVPPHSQPDYRLGAPEIALSGPLTLGLYGEDRASDHLVFVEPRLSVEAHEDDGRKSGHAGGYASSAVALYPGGFQSATIGAEYDGRGIGPGDAWVMQAHLRAFVEGTVFDRARASHAGDAALPHSLVGGFATGLGAEVGGSVASFGFDVRGGVNRPALLRDLPTAHGHGDVAMIGWLRITPPIPHHGGVVAHPANEPLAPDASVPDEATSPAAP